jgi:glutathione S-transferase
MQIYAKGITDIEVVLPQGFGTPQFRQAFPIGRIPVLDIDGDMMPESEVISEYLEELYPEPSLLGSTPRERAHVRTIARIGDIYIMNNMFMLSPQSQLAEKNQGIVDLLGGQVMRNMQALDAMIADDGYACGGALSMADCALVPALFLVENVWPAFGDTDLIGANAKVAAYWARIQRNEHAAKVLAELHRGLAQRREAIRTGAFQKTMAAMARAQAEA